MGIRYHRPSYQVVASGLGRDALERIGRAGPDRPDLVLLDLSLPDVHGLEIIRRIRASGDTIPIVVLTVVDDEQTLVRALESGADDFITKPFSHRVLVARVDAVLRRHRFAQGEGHDPLFRLGGLAIDFPQHKVTVDGEERFLTPTEYNLLYQLATNPGRVITHEALLSKVWGEEYREDIHYLTVYVGRLRAKLEADPEDPRYIRTVRGVGYEMPRALT